jgi:hypothetical protein
VELGEPGDEREADAHARAGSLRAPAERLEDRVALFFRDPRAVVLDGDHHPCVRACDCARVRAALGLVDGDPHRGVRRRVSHGVREEVLDDALHHRLVDHHGDRLAVDVNAPLRDHAGLGDLAPDQRADVDRLKVELHDAAPEPVEVEEIVHEPVELARVRRDAPGHLLRLLGGEMDVVALERQRHAEDRRERRPEIVGDGLDERVLHLVGLAELIRGQALLLQCLLQLLGTFLPGDVDHHPLPVLGVPLVVPDHDGPVVDPDDAPVLPLEAVLQAVGLGAPPVAARLGEHPLPVLGMQDALPQALVARPLLRRVAEELLHLRGDVDRRLVS